MATILQGKCRAYGTVSGNSPRLLYFHERQGETFKKGALLYLNASNYLRVAPIANGCASAFDTIRKRIIGIAAKDAQNFTTTAQIQASLTPVWHANSDTIFLSNAFSETSAAASSLAYADEGKALTASVNASIVYVELAASAASTILKVVQFVDQKGDRYGRVLWQLLPGARALGF